MFLFVLGAYSAIVPLAASGTSTGAIAGVSVEASGPQEGYGTSGASGTYSVNLTRAGSYNVSATADGFINAFLSSLVAVTLGHTTPGADFNLARSSIVTGRVTGPGGVPVAGAEVTLATNSTGNEVGTDFTTSDGQYAIDTNVPAGLYQLRVSMTSELSLFQTSCVQYGTVCPDDPLYAPGFLNATVTGITVGAQTTVVKNVQLAYSAAIVGQVTYQGSGVSGVEVLVNSTCLTCTTVTNATGWYSIADNLNSGHYKVSLSSTYGYGLSAHAVPTGNANVTATAGSVTRQNFALSKSATVSGTVKDTHGNPVVGATVELGTNSCFESFCYFVPQLFNTTNANGQYVFEAGVAAGSYNVTVAKGKAEASLTSPLAVAAGASVTAPTITLTIPTPVAPAHITGTVKGTGGNPMEYAEVTATGATCSCSNSTETNAEGQFNLEIGLTTAQNVNVTADYSGFTEASTLLSAVSPGSTVSAGTLTLTAIVPGVISGTVQGQIISSLIQPTRVQKWTASDHAVIVTKTDSEFSVEGLAGFAVEGSTVAAYVSGPEGTTGSFTIEIPQSVISGSSWTVSVDGTPVSATVNTNSTYTTITVTYAHSSHLLAFTPSSTTTSTSSTSHTTPSITTTTSSSTTTTTHPTTSTTASSGSSTSHTSSSTTTSSTQVTTSTSSSTTSTSSSVTSPTSSSTTPSTTSSGGGGVPEFPAQAGGVVALTVVVVAAYAILRRGSKLSRE
jgi:hypothetical protein